MVPVPHAFKMPGFSYIHSPGLDSMHTFFGTESGIQQAHVQIAIATLVIGLLVPLCFHLSRENEVLPVVNRLFRLEPRVFARFRWAFNSKQILEEADKKVP